MNRSENWIVRLIMGLAIFSALLILLNGKSSPREQDLAQEFHRLVGHLHFGKSLDLDDPIFCFDGRLHPDHSDDPGPISTGLNFFLPK